MIALTGIAVLALLLMGLILWLVVQLTHGQKKNEALETQMNEMRRDLLGLSTAQTQSSTKMETIAGAIAERLESIPKALQDGAKNSAELTSQITSQAQSAMSTELKNTREQITQIQQQLGQVQQAGQLMHETAGRLENILGGSKSRGNFGEMTLERLLEDCLAPSQYSRQYRFRSGESVDAVVRLRDQKLLPIDSKFPLEAYLRLGSEGDEARKAFVSAVKKHADEIAKLYIVPDEGTLDVAFMFVPSETIYYELLMSSDSKGQQLDAYCRSRKIIAVSPNTLYAYFSVVAMGLRGMQIEENAKRLAANLAGLRKQLENFAEPFKRIGTQLNYAQSNFIEADKRLDKASNTLNTLLTASDPTQPAMEDGEASPLALPAPTAAKKSA